MKRLVILSSKLERFSGFGGWHMGNQSQDEVFLAAQEAVGAHRDSQGRIDDLIFQTLLLQCNSCIHGNILDPSKLVTLPLWNLSLHCLLHLLAMYF